MKAKSNKKISEKITTRLFVGVAILCLVVSAALFGGRLVLASTDSAAEKAMSEAVVLYALEHPDSKMALLLAEYLLVSEQSVLENLKASNEGMVGVLRDDENQLRAERVCTKYADSQFKYSCEGWGRFNIPSATSATSTASEVNRLGIDAVVDYAEVVLTGTVSSTFNVFVGTATSTFVQLNAGAGGLHPRPDNLIDGFEFVTSSVPVDSPNRLDTYRNVINSHEDQGTNGIQSAELASSSAILFYMASDYGASCGSGTGLNFCTQVTSTGRGFDGFVRYKFRYEVDL